MTPLSPNTCPVCGARLAEGAGPEDRLFPFCSDRCKQVDLYRWRQGKYAIVQPLWPADFMAPDGAPPIDELELEGL